MDEISLIACELTEDEWRAVESMRAAHAMIGGDPPVPFDNRRMATEILRLRGQLRRVVDAAEIVAWLRGRTGYGGGFTSADDVADAVERHFITERGR